jgi:hypothetical protein
VLVPCASLFDSAASETTLHVTRLLLVILVLLCGVVGALFVREEQAHSRGIAHPEHGAMMLGADGESRHRSLLPLGWAFAALQVAFFVGLIALALRRGDGRVPAWPALVLVGGVYLAMFALLFVAYGDFAAGEPVELVFGFPAPTAWMLFGVWSAPMLFLLLYVLRFDALVWTAESRARFERLLAQRRGPN